MALILHAPNVHVGGGKVLLLQLLTAISQRSDARAIVDERLPLPPGLPATAIAFRAPPTVTGRLRAERVLRREARAADTVLCFGNLPPLFRLRAKAALFVQNLYLASSRSTAAFPLRARLRLAAERLWLRHRIGNVRLVVVQTASMKREIDPTLGVDSVVMAFHDGATPRPPECRATRYDFLYIASGEPHKNHRTLIDAWIALAREGIRPRLCLTLSAAREGELHGLMAEAVRTHGLAIDNVDPDRDGPQVSALYAESAALVFPSAFESLGLPLLEARAAGLPVLASEADYVRDVLDPDQSFDPSSSVSIARAVKRHLKLGENRPAAGHAADFLDFIESRI